MVANYAESRLEDSSSQLIGYPSFEGTDFIMRIPYARDVFKISSQTRVSAKTLGLLYWILVILGPAARANSFYTRRLDDPKAVYVAPANGGDDTVALQQAINRVQETAGQGIVPKDIRKLAPFLRHRPCRASLAGRYSMTLRRAAATLGDERWRRTSPPQGGRQR